MSDYKLVPLGVVAEAGDACRELSNGEAQAPAFPRGKAQLEEGPKAAEAQHPEVQSRTLCDLWATALV